MKNFFNSIGLILSWIFGGVFIITSIVMYSETPLFAFFLLLMGLFLLPPINKKLEEKTKHNLSGWRKPVIAILFFFIFGIVAGISEQSPTPEKHIPQTTKIQKIEQKVIAKEKEIIQEISPKVVVGEAKTEAPIQTPKKEKVQDENLVQVLKIVDGDTIDVLYKGKEERLRIKGINTPETKDPRYPVQCFGKEASAKAKEILEGKNIILETDGSRGKYGRLLAYLRLLNGSDYGERMIREGYAWHYRSYPHERMDVYDEAEKYARENNVGLWSPDTCSGEKKPLEEVVEETKKSVSEVILPPPVPQQKVETEPVAVPTQPPTQQAPQNSPSKSYDCSGDVYNCGDFKLHLEAQNAFDYCYQINGGDIHKLDRDNNGVACEGLKK